MQPALEDPSLVHPKLLCRLEMPPWTLPTTGRCLRPPVSLPLQPRPTLARDTPAEPAPMLPLSLHSQKF